MSRAVYIGGFGNGRSSAEGVAEVLSNYYEDVEPYTFSKANSLANGVNSNQILYRALFRATVFTHSAGLLPVKRAGPVAIHAFNGPLPLSRSQLFGRSFLKTARMHTPGVESGKPSAVAKYDVSATAELALHPVLNFEPFLKKQISSFNTFTMLALKSVEGSAATAVYSTDDVFFQPTLADSAYAYSRGVRIAAPIPGEHDILPLAPDQILPEYIEQYV